MRSGFSVLGENRRYCVQDSVQNSVIRGTHLIDGISVQFISRSNPQSRFDMNPVFVLPAIVVVAFSAFFTFKYYHTFAADQLDEYEHDGNQTTKIRHEANL